MLPRLNTTVRIAKERNELRRRLSATPDLLAVCEKLVAYADATREEPKAAELCIAIYDAIDALKRAKGG